MRPYTLICADAIEAMRTFPAKSFDLVVTSPPYNLRNSTGNGMKKNNKGRWGNALLIQGYENCSDDMPYEQYISWQRKCLFHMYRLIKDTGAIFYNHKWRVQGGLLQDRSEILKGFPVRQIIIWKRQGGINYNLGYFLPTYEVIYLIAKPKFKLVRHAPALGDIWDVPQEKNTPHPAPFPVLLTDKIIVSTEAENVLDPFCGWGTTGVSCLKYGKRFVGIDNSPQYIQMATQRLEEYREKLANDNQERS